MIDWLIYLSMLLQPCTCVSSLGILGTLKVVLATSEPEPPGGCCCYFQTYHKHYSACNEEKMAYQLPGCRQERQKILLGVQEWLCPLPGYKGFRLKSRMSLVRWPISSLASCKMRLLMASSTQAQPLHAAKYPLLLNYAWGLWKTWTRNTAFDMH